MRIKKFSWDPPQWNLKCSFQLRVLGVRSLLIIYNILVVVSQGFIQSVWCAESSESGSTHTHPEISNLVPHDLERVNPSSGEDSDFNYFTIGDKAVSLRSSTGGGIINVTFAVISISQAGLSSSPHCGTFLKLRGELGMPEYHIEHGNIKQTNNPSDLFGFSRAMLDQLSLPRSKGFMANRPKTKDIDKYLFDHGGSSPDFVFMMGDPIKIMEWIVRNWKLIMALEHGCPALKISLISL